MLRLLEGTTLPASLVRYVLHTSVVLGTKIRWGRDLSSSALKEL